MQNHNLVSYFYYNLAGLFITSLEHFPQNSRKIKKTKISKDADLS